MDGFALFASFNAGLALPEIRAGFGGSAFAEFGQPLIEITLGMVIPLISSP